MKTQPSWLGRTYNNDEMRGDEVVVRGNPTTGEVKTSPPYYRWGLYKVARAVLFLLLFDQS